LTIPAKYEDGVFKPLGEVRLTEGTKVEVHVPEQCDDIPDGVAYEDRMRARRH